ncbi:radical SAM protein [soil metagenome]
MSRPPFKRILLINPPTGLYRRDDRCQCTVEDQTVQVVFPPMDLALAAGCAERDGATCRIEDYPAVGRGWEAFIADLNEYKPDMLMLNSTTATLEGDLETCRLAKEHIPGIFTAAKGETLVVNAIPVLRDHHELDFILPNEAEEAVGELARGVNFCDIKGSHFLGALLERYDEAPADTLVEPEGKAQISKIKRRSAAEERVAVMEPEAPPTDRAFFTGKRDLQQNLDSLPFPARHLLKNYVYTSPETGNPIAVVHGNRGCPSKCVFCPAGVLTDFTVRFRATDRIVAELKECVEVHGIREFLFHGDTFTINKRWLLELCEKIRAAGLDIRWGCNSRVDTMDDERAQAMKAAGCWVVAFGIETGDDAMLEHMKKNATTAQAREAVACVKRNGLRVHTFFVIGLPWETEETLARTYKFIQDLDPDFFDFNIATPLPGTELHTIALENNLFEKKYDPARTGYASGSTRTFSGLGSEYLQKWRREHLLKMFLRPRYIARMLTRAGGPKKTFQYARAGAKRLRQLITSKASAAKT